jgi:uncharacterized protein (TIGR02452 family)
MNREERKKLGQDTLKILEEGYYLIGSRAINIKGFLDYSLANTKLYLPSDYESLQKRVNKKVQRYKTKIEIVNKTSLTATKESSYIDAKKVCCLNFASAKNPGGGFLSGSQAQEESLARSSGLYHSISQQVRMYEYNKKLKTCLYSDHIIYSPQVPIFRDDEGSFLEIPYFASFITAPAVNAGAIMENEKGNIAKIIPYMQRRAKYVFFIAAENMCDTLVLGAWGCGVFKNNPGDIARIFYELVFNDVETKGLFKEIVFAIYDYSSDKSVLNVFKREFE